MNKRLKITETKSWWQKDFLKECGMNDHTFLVMEENNEYFKVKSNINLSGHWTILKQGNLDYVIITDIECILPEGLFEI